MKLLLDTHTFVWWDSDPGKLSTQALSACLDRANNLHLSIVSIWELQIKIQLGKLALRLPLEEVLKEQQQDDLMLAHVELEDIFQLAALPMIHRDPFDRLILAQAVRGGFHLVSRDRQMAMYGVQTLW